MRAYSHDSILRDDFDISPEDPEPLIATIICCSLCNKEVRSVVSLDIETWKSSREAHRDSEVKICRRCLELALSRLDTLKDEDKAFRRQRGDLEDASQ